MFLRPNTPILLYSNTPFVFSFASYQIRSGLETARLAVNKAIAIIPAFVGRIGKLYQGGKPCFSKCAPMC
jgi:hypothetical protein